MTHLKMCKQCGKALSPILIDQNIDYHIECAPESLEERNIRLKDKLTEIICWVDDNAPRSRQVEIGPSEMGSPCEQQIARILAGMPRVNFHTDPWAAIVGTSIHKWIENAINTFQSEGPQDSWVAQWKTEMAVMLDENIPGHTDIFDGLDVIDVKTAGVDAIPKLRKAGEPPENYKVQGHLYGYAHRRAGRPVRDVVLVFLPRAGWLKDMFIWREPYNETVALEALERVYRIGDEAIQAGVLDDPANWAKIPTAPAPECWFCSYFVSRPSEMLPDATGCPGNSKTAAERTEAQKAKFARGLI